MDPLAGSPWSSPSTVAGFAASPPNAVLMQYASGILGQSPHSVVLDIGCGAGRNAVPIAAIGGRVVGVDLSLPMLEAARTRVADAAPGSRPSFVLAPHDALPIASGVADLIIAHGIWNLSRSTAEFRRGIREAARIASGRACLFVFTFSRGTIPDDVEADPADPYVFTTFSGQPQCFVTPEQLVSELHDVGFEPDPAVPMTEYNRRTPGAIGRPTAPVILECGFIATRNAERGVRN